MKIEGIKLEVVAGRVVERFSDGAIEDSIIGRQEASQLLACRGEEQIKVVVKKGGYTFRVVAERQSTNFFCHIKERDEDRAIAEYYYKYSASDIEKVAAGRGWWRVGPAERKRAEKKWYR